MKNPYAAQFLGGLSRTILTPDPAKIGRKQPLRPFIRRTYTF